MSLERGPVTLPLDLDDFVRQQPVGLAVDGDGGLAPGPPLQKTLPVASSYQ
jgi:hypothetical protein